VKVVRSEEYIVSPVPVSKLTNGIFTIVTKERKRKYL